MSFLGMGPLEIMVILLLAFIFLGPQKMIDVARWLGKASREVRRMTEDLNTMIMDEAAKPAETTSTGASGEKSVVKELAPGQTEATTTTIEDEGPVAVSTRNSQLTTPQTTNDDGPSQTEPSPHS